MSESDPAPTPSSASAAGSSSSGSTPKARKGLAARPRQIAAAGMTSGTVIVVLLWVAALAIPMRNGFLYGAASGGTAVMLALVALLVAKRFGYDTFFVRELEKREDERDRAASRRAWALVGVVGFIGNLVAVPVGAFGGRMEPVVGIVLCLQVFGLIGANIYFDRTM